MSRSNRLYKETYNACLNLVGEYGVGASLPSEPKLAERLSASRTTVRAVLRRLDDCAVIRWRARDKTILRTPHDGDFFAPLETQSAQQVMEPAFMAYILGGGLEPGAILRESELAREFSVSTSAVREYMIRFSRFGLIEKKPNRHWVLKGFTRDFAMELCDVRELYEVSALSALRAKPLTLAFRKELDDLEREHRFVLDDVDSRYLHFPRLDDRFHRLIQSLRRNRFVADFSDLVSLIFHYHYRWNKRGEKQRNIAAAVEHLRVIDALRAQRPDEAVHHLKAHLQTARRTLLSSVAWDEGAEQAA